MDSHQDAAPAVDNAFSHAKEPIPAVRIIELDQFSFTPIFKSAPNTAEREDEFNQLLMLDLAHSMVAKQFRSDQPPSGRDKRILRGILKQIDSPENSEALADALVKNMLSQIAEHLADKNQRKFYSSKDLTQNERLMLLKFCSSAERVKFIETLVDLASSDGAVAGFLDAKLGNCLAYTSLEERAGIAKKLLHEGTNPFVNSYLCRLVGASRSLEEYSKTVSLIGPEILLATQDKALRDIVTRAEIGQKLRSLPMPGALELGAKPELINANIKALNDSLEHAIEIISLDKQSDRTGLSWRYFEIAMSNLEELRAGLKSPKSWEQIREHVNYISLKSAIELRYGIRLSGEDSSFFSPGAKWDLGSLKSVEATLARLPEGLLFRTPNLAEIKRVHEIAPGVMGQRLDSGLILITDLAIDNDRVQADYSEYTSLEVVLTHEIGHGVQLGDNKSDLVQAADGSIELSPGDPEFEFKEFMRLSGWQLVNPERIQLTDNRFTILLDGQEIEVGEPTEHNGELITVISNQGLVFSYSSLAKFSVVPYSRTNPWEDWAEAFAEYFLRPDRLIRIAPLKFRHLEEEFKHYQDRPDLLVALKKALEPKAG